MNGFAEQTTSENERSHPIVPDKQLDERSIPSEWALSGRRESRIVYSHERHGTSYSILLRGTPGER
jgi:hypothetical protein